MFPQLHLTAFPARLLPTATLLPHLSQLRMIFVLDDSASTNYRFRDLIE
jgi:hypothetical protein